MCGVYTGAKHFTVCRDTTHANATIVDAMVALAAANKFGFTGLTTLAPISTGHF